MMLEATVLFHFAVANFSFKRLKQIYIQTSIKKMGLNGSRARNRPACFLPGLFQFDARTEISLKGEGFGELLMNFRGGLSLS